MRTVAVLGGGVSGLSAAYYLSKIASPAVVKKIILVEASARTGGWINTTRFDDGVIFEHGPRSLRGFGKSAINTLELVDELGLTRELLPIPRDHVVAQNRYLYVKGQLCALPKGFAGVAFRQPPFSKSILAQAWREPFIPKSQLSDESLHSFVSRRLGPEIAKYLIDPLCRGIFAGKSTQLSVKCCFPDLHNYEMQYGSIIKGMMKAPKVLVESKSDLVARFRSEKWPVFTFRRGLSQITDALLTELDKDERITIVKQAPCSKIQLQEHKLVLTLPDKEIEVDHLISSINSKYLAKLLPDQFEKLTQKLRSIPAVTVGVVNLEFSGQVFPLQGFGHLVPSSEGGKVMGVIYDSCVSDQHNNREKPTSRLTCMMGGAWFQELFGSEDAIKPDGLVPVALDALQEQLNISKQPLRVVSQILKGCIPQYLVGHSDLVDDIDSLLAESKMPISLIGSSYQGVSVNDCILNAKSCIEALNHTLLQS